MIKWENVEPTAKMGSAIVALIAVIVGVFEYFNTREFEAKSPFFEKQFELYLSASDAAAHLATVQCSEHDAHCVASYLDACRSFYRLYWGQMGVVEDRLVVQGMNDFRGALVGAHGATCDPQTIGELARTKKGQEMRDASISLARCVSRSLQDNWQVKLRTIECKIKKNDEQ